MAIAELLATLERDAEAERRAVEVTAEAEAAAIVAAASRAEHDRSSAELSEFTARRRAEADAEVATASARARSAVLDARAALLTRLEAATRAALPPAIAARADRVAPVLVDALLEAVGEGAVIVRCAPVLLGAVHARIAARCRAKLSLEAAADVETGVVATLDGGRVVVDATLATRLDLDWGQLAPAALAAALAVGRAALAGTDQDAAGAPPPGEVEGDAGPPLGWPAASVRRAAGGEP